MAPDERPMPARVSSTTSAKTREVQLSGRIGTLNESQQAAFDCFKQMAQEQGYYTPGEEGSQGSHDESTLLRFLRARKFDVDAGLQQFISTEKWRKQVKIDQQYDEFDTDEFLMSQKVYTQWTGRRTKAGQPLYLYRIGALDKEKINAYSKKAERLNTRMSVLTEMMTAFTLPFTSSLPRPNPEIPIDATTTIVDISGVSLSRFWSLRTHMQRASTLATANYPETIGVLFIVGAPSFFSVVWGWVNRWFDQGTVEKMYILAEHEVLPTLSKFVAVEDIPKQYGGELDFKFGDGPNLDKAALEKLGLGSKDELPLAPIRFDARTGLKVVGSGRSEADQRLNGRGASQSKGAEATESEVTGLKEGSRAEMEDEGSDKEQENESTMPAVKAASPTAEPSSDQAERASLDGRTSDGSEQTLAPPILAGVKLVNPGKTSGGDHAALPALEAAKQFPEAPIKDLAAQLEGTTL